MKIRQIAQLCSWSLGIFLFCNLPAIAESLSTSPQQQQLIQQKILQELAKVNVVYLGETHDNPEDHKAQLKIIQELYQQHPKIAIAMEMFQRPYQGILDRYLAGELSETQLLEQTQYQKRWGFPWEYYAPIVQFARNNHLPVLALNTPAEVTRKVARQGLESLDESERVYIPDFAEIRTDNAEYRQIIQAAYEQHHPGSHSSSINFERFFLAQVLWDETMAAAIAQFLQANPDYQVIVLAGQGHIIYGYGIPDRVARRIDSKSFIQRSIILNPDPKIPSQTDKPVADYFWFSGN